MAHNVGSTLMDDGSSIGMQKQDESKFRETTFSNDLSLWQNILHLSNLKKNDVLGYGQTQGNDG